MPGWLKSLVGFFTGTFSVIWDKVVSLVTTVYRWLDKEIVILRNDIVSAFNDVYRLADEIANFVYHTYNTFVAWVDHTFNAVLKWAENEIATVTRFANAVLAWAVREFDTVNRWVTGLFNAVYRWVITEIWDPLYRDISGAIGWITHEGAFVYDLLTHPDKLTALILAYVWAAWLGLFREFAKPIVSYILHSLRRNIPDLVSVLEDIISSIL
jgi:phage-related protein